MTSKLIIALGIFLAAAQARQFGESEHPQLGFSLPNFGINRIIGGVEAKKNDHPHQVSLQWGMPPVTIFSHFCGGSILNEKWILTAAHCVLAVPSYGSFAVKAGKHVLKVTENEEQVVEVSSFFIHQNYSGGVAPYDVALLKLKASLVINKYVSPINLPRQGAVHTGNVTLTGWGSIVPSGTTLPTKLQTAILPIVDFATCKSSIEKLVGPSPLHETNVCTGPLTGGFSACSGDSGGPLILRNASRSSEVVGIVSWGIMPCGTKGAPSVYTKVSAFVDWIQLTISQNSL